MRRIDKQEKEQEEEQEKVKQNVTSNDSLRTNSSSEEVIQNKPIVTQPSESKSTKYRSKELHIQEIYSATSFFKREPSRAPGRLDEGSTNSESEDPANRIRKIAMRVLASASGITSATQEKFLKALERGTSGAAVGGVKTTKQEGSKIDRDLIHKTVILQITNFFTRLQEFTYENKGEDAVFIEKIINFLSLGGLKKVVEVRNDPTNFEDINNNTGKLFYDKYLLLWFCVLNENNKLVLSILKEKQKERKKEKKDDDRDVDIWNKDAFKKLLKDEIIELSKLKKDKYNLKNLLSEVEKQFDNVSTIISKFLHLDYEQQELKKTNKRLVLLPKNFNGNELIESILNAFFISDLFYKSKLIDLIAKHLTTVNNYNADYVYRTVFEAKSPTVDENSSFRNTF